MGWASGGGGGAVVWASWTGSSLAPEPTTGVAAGTRLVSGAWSVPAAISPTTRSGTLKANHGAIIRMSASLLVRTTEAGGPVGGTVPIVGAIGATKPSELFLIIPKTVAALPGPI